MMRGIDVSEWNGLINWEAVASAGYEFAIVRCTMGKNNRDENFLANVEGAHAAGLKVGAYHYSYALTPEDAIVEAQSCRAAIEEAGVLLELPVWFDFEDADGYKRKHGFDFHPWNCTEICRAFIDNIGLDCGVYASLSYLENYVDWRSLGCAVWNAQWGATDDIGGMMWQYTDRQHIPGASSNELFDANIIY